MKRTILAVACLLASACPSPATSTSTTRSLAEASPSPRRPPPPAAATRRCPRPRCHRRRGRRRSASDCKPHPSTVDFGDEPALEKPRSAEARGRTRAPSRRRTSRRSSPSTCRRPRSTRSIRASSPCSPSAEGPVPRAGRVRRPHAAAEAGDARGSLRHLDEPREGPPRHRGPQADGPARRLAHARRRRRAQVGGLARQPDRADARRGRITDSRPSSNLKKLTLSASRRPASRAWRPSRS